jgi:hypothetical protein
MKLSSLLMREAFLNKDIPAIYRIMCAEFGLGIPMPTARFYADSRFMLEAIVATDYKIYTWNEKVGFDPHGLPKAAPPGFYIWAPVPFGC